MSITLRCAVECKLQHPPFDIVISARPTLKVVALQDSRLGGGARSASAGDTDSAGHRTAAATPRMW